MAYLGGKSTCFKHIIEKLNHEDYNGAVYLEPFMGYAHILKRIENKKQIYAGDSNKLITILFNGLKRNKLYPKISKKKYNDLKNEKKKSFNQAYAAFALSYGGKEWGGYTPLNLKHNRNYELERQNYYESLKKNKSFKKSVIKNLSYDEWCPKNLLIYCDPPYENTTSYGKSCNLNYDLFWDTMREWSNENIVYISEYNAPEDFVEVSNAEKFTTISGVGSIDKRLEKLFQYKNKPSKMIDLTKPKLIVKKKLKKK